MTTISSMLDHEEYVEQAHFYRVLSERLPENVPLQELLQQVREEVLVTTKLPLAIDYMLSELLHSGNCSTAMKRLDHYFTPFQTYIMQEAENELGRFDMRVAVEVLRQDALYRGNKPTPQGVFLFQFETLCRNRLSYDHGLKAVSEDPIFDDDWRPWILKVRRQIGMVDLADVIYVSSQYYLVHHAQKRNPDRIGQAARSNKADEPQRLLFGEMEGKIALANRKKDPLFLFSALQRQLGYPKVPRPKPRDETSQILPQILRRLERMEVRLKLVEEEQKGGIDLSQFYLQDGKTGPPPPAGQ